MCTIVFGQPFVFQPQPNLCTQQPKGKVEGKKADASAEKPGCRGVPKDQRLRSPPLPLRWPVQSVWGLKVRAMGTGSLKVLKSHPLLKPRP